MKIFSVLLIVVALSSCSKDNLTCVAKDAQGNEMYEIVGSDVCENQISIENGEYCDCSK